MESSKSVQVQQTNDLNFFDSVLYKAAAEGQIHPFNAYTEPLDLLLTPTKNTILHIHITYPHPSIPFLDEILTKCPSLLLQTNNKDETPLHIAAKHGHVDIVKFLTDSTKARHQDIETGVGAARDMLRMVNIHRETALHEAIKFNVGVVEVLIEEDPDFTYSANKAGETPLYLAAQRGFRDMAVKLLNTCTSPVYHGPNGRTALHEAVIRNDSVIISKILEKKKSLVKEVDKQGWAPLHHASHLGNLSIVKQLLECDKAVAYIGDKNGKNPLHLAASTESKGHNKVVSCIIEHCPDCHEHVDVKGRNVLHFLALSLNFPLLNDMFSDANKKKIPSLTNLINEKDVDGNTPVHLAATYCVDSWNLIRHPLADRMVVNNNNATPLDACLANANEHGLGFMGETLKTLKKGGYKESQPTVIKESNIFFKGTIDAKELESMKSAHMVVAALIVTVTFAAGFTMPGGYNSEEGSAILSRNAAFKTFILTDSMALLMSTCALFFYYTCGYNGLMSKRKMNHFIFIASFLIMLAIILMLIAFAAGAYSVLPDSPNIGAAICVITSIFLIICYTPLKLLF